ncbi:MAG: ABC transporter permease subunit [Ignavibacteriales bacterium]|nr:ABC transporter permease subunit [Ignavibacteriales bacterium]
MWRIFLEKELKDSLQSARFVVTSLVSIALIALSFYLGIAHYQARLSQYEQSQQMMLETASQQTNWMAASVFAFRKPDPMEVFVNGINSDIGRYSEINQMRGIKLVRSEFGDDPMLAVFQFLDLSFVVQIVLSLMAILFTYNAINGEKEGGTLKLIFANQISKAEFILGKLLGNWVALLVPFIISFLIGAMLIIAMGVEMSAAHWGRFAIFAFSAVLYFTCFMLIGVFVSALTKRSSLSFLILLVCWIVSVLIIPKAATMLAGQAMPVPSADEIESRIASFSTQARTEFFASMNKLFAERFRPVEGQSQEQRDQFVRENQERWQQEEKEIRETMDKKIAEYSARQYEDLYNQKNSQELLALSLSKFSPASAFQLVAMKLGGTDTGLKRRYEDAMKDYRKQYTNFLSDKGGGHGGIRLSVSNGRGTVSAAEPKKINIAEMPKFSDPVYGAGEAINASLFDVGLLALFNILAFVGAFVAFLHYDLR